MVFVDGLRTLEYMRHISKSIFSRLKIFRLVKENIFHNNDLYELLCNGIPIKKIVTDIEQGQLVFKF